MKPPPLPALSTLSYPPSWLNNAGNLDRSACFEIRLKEVRQLAGCVRVRQAARLRGTHRVRDTQSKVQPLPNEMQAVNGLGRVTTGVYELTKHDLELMAQFRVPRAQAGDHRSARANAMQDRRRNKIHKELHDGLGDGRVRDTRGKPRWKTNVRGIPHDQRDEPLPDDRLYTNAWPNLLGHGKVLGVPHDWMQPVRLEKWLYPKISPPYAAENNNPIENSDAVGDGDAVGNAIVSDGESGDELVRNRRPIVRGCGSGGNAAANRELLGDSGCNPGHARGYAVDSNTPAPLPKYYLVCPGVLPDERATKAQAAYRKRRQNTSKKMKMTEGHALQTARPTGIGNDARLAALSDAPLGAKPVGCPQRVRMLLMPLCWPEEYTDAMTAQRWIDSLTVHQRSVATDTVTKLTWRYGMLFSPRTMLCRQCLDAKKGTHPETKRRGTRKRNKASMFNPIVKQPKRGLVS